MSRNRIIAGIAAVCFITGVALSHQVEAGVHLEKVTLAEDTPAWQHPVPGFRTAGATWALALASSGDTRNLHHKRDLLQLRRRSTR